MSRHFTKDTATGNAPRARQSQRGAKIASPDALAAELAALARHSSRDDGLAAVQAMNASSPGAAEAVQLRAAIDASARVRDQARLAALAPAGPGMALPAVVQARMENAFAADFSAVRVHQGPQAEALGALAYTQGADIHFAPGHYDPVSVHGQELLGHELAHVVQQSQGRVSTPSRATGLPVNEDPSLEREAGEMGARAARGQRAHEARAESAGATAAGRGSTLPVQRLKNNEQEVDIDELDYNTAYAYLIKLREKQVDEAAHPKIEFDMDEDPAALQQRIDTLEPNQGTVLCAEGQAKRAKKTQQIAFGTVTSCLTFTCILEDESKIVAHEAIKNRVPSGAVQAIKNLAADDTITKVVIVGVAGAWTWHDGVLAPLGNNREHLIDVSPDTFASEFATAIGAEEGAFKHHIAGDVTMNAAGVYQDPWAAADTKLQEHFEDTLYSTTKAAAIAHLAEKVYGGNEDRATEALKVLVELNGHYKNMISDYE